MRVLIVAIVLLPNVCSGQVRIRVPFVEVDVGPGVRVRAPFTNVEVGPGVRVRAPFTNVEIGPGVHVRAPLTNVNVPPASYHGHGFYHPYGYHPGKHVDRSLWWCRPRHRPCWRR